MFEILNVGSQLRPPTLHIFLVKEVAPGQEDVDAASYCV